MTQLMALVLMLATPIGSFVYAAASSGNSNSTATLGAFIERAPESAVAPKGDEVVFECELNLKPDRLKWRFRRNSGLPFSDLPPAAGYNVTSSSDEHTWKLRIYVSAQTLGEYQCVAWYGPGALASTPARLTLVSISIDNTNNGGYSRHALIWSVAPRNCVLIRCGTVTSNPPAIWSFYRNGEKVPQSEQMLGGGGTAADGALILTSVSAKDAGNYSCAATNAITGVEVRLPQVIDLRVDYTDRTPPYFLVQQPTVTELSARPGETVVLECPGVGSPRPVAVWSSPNVTQIFHNRTKVLPYGLHITDVRPIDQGTYVCRLDNGIAPVLVRIIQLIVLERPRIIRGPASTLTNEGDMLLLECNATGNPQPEIYWLINGEDASSDNETLVQDHNLMIHHVQKRHAGIVQCFARNILGEISEGNMLGVNPLEISGEDFQPLGGNLPMRPLHDEASTGSGSSFMSNGGSSSSGSSSSRNNKGKRKYMRVANMVPPSRPNVTRLSDDSVMLRWNVPKNDGLAIQFFKVQYRMLGDSSRKIARENWQTTNEYIPYGRQRSRDRHDHSDGGGAKNFTSSVTGLHPDRYYRFRIVAVYSNNDNKEGNTSVKFFLQHGAAKSDLPVPDLRDVEPYTESAVVLHWSLAALPAQSQLIDGYYAYYRQAASAGEYLKATVDGGHARRFKIDMLEPGTAYEFKLQSFNAHSASEFSVIRQASTKKSQSNHGIPSGATPIAPVIKPASNSIYPVIAGAAGGGLLLLIATVVACLCLRRRKIAQPEDENKPQLDHIQADFVTSAVLGVAPHHHKAGDVRRLNGVIPRMNITPNPLAASQDPASGDKSNAVAAALHQPGLHHAQPYHPPGTPTLLHKRLDYHHQHQHHHHSHHQQQQAPPVPPHAAYYQQTPPPSSSCTASPMMERSVRSQQSYGHMDENGLPSTPTRIPSLRRQRRASAGGHQQQQQQHNSSHSNLNLSIGNHHHHNNNNNNLPPHHQHLHHHHGGGGGGGGGGVVGIPIVPGSPRVQRSPMPSRALIKRTRLGSHTDNISSGSLNSIEV
ncbi:interference hedgehog isoform X2 [Drosophila willistoni]|nr:interference hedgehog isoform X2 [Drosophila willistoni]